MIISIFLTILMTFQVCFSMKMKCQDRFFKDEVESIEIESRGCLNQSANCPLFYIRSLDNYDDHVDEDVEDKFLFIGWKNAFRKGIELISIENQTKYCNVLSNFFDSSKEIVDWISIQKSKYYSNDYSLFVLNGKLENETNVEEILITFKLKNNKDNNNYNQNKSILIYRFPNQNISINSNDSYYSSFEPEDFIQILIEHVFSFEELTSIDISITWVVAFVLFTVLVLLAFALCVDE